LRPSESSGTIFDIKAAVYEIHNAVIWKDADDDAEEEEEEDT